MEKLFNKKFWGKIEIFFIFLYFEKNLKIKKKRIFGRKKIFLKNPKNLKKMWKIHIFNFLHFFEKFKKNEKSRFYIKKYFFEKSKNL